MNTRKIVPVALCAFALPVAAQAALVAIDFGPSNATTPTNAPASDGNYWNNVTVSPTAMVLPPSLIDSTGAAAGFTLTMDASGNNAFNTQANAAGAATYTYTNAAGVTGLTLPSSVSSDSLFGNVEAFNSQSNRSPVITFSGLSSSFTYTFTVFAARAGVADVRSGLYTATGLNSDFGVLDASNNSTVAIHLRDIVPAADGSITFTMVEAGTNTNSNSFFYLNALMITSTAAAVPEPGAFAALAGLGALGFVGLRRRARQPAVRG